MNHMNEEQKLNSAPKNVASHLWEKFKALEKRTNEVTQRSTEKRIKHLQKQVLETVTKEFTSDEDKDILRHYDVKFGPSVEKPQESYRKRKKKNCNSFSSEINTETTEGPVEELKKYMGINDHLVTTDHSRPPPPTALDKKIDAAIKDGDFEAAEALSDHLSEREAGERIVAAIESKRFLEQKEVEKESVKVKKKRKLNWGFEPKQRWETKGNM